MVNDRISALVLAAGHSSRMGQSKMTLPWGETTVLGKVITSLLKAQLTSIYVITGGNQELIESTLQGFPVRYVNNINHSTGEMLSSIQAGLKSLTSEMKAALIVLGDQPQIEVDIYKLIIDEYSNSNAKIIVPSYHMHRGHPLLVDRSYWDEINRLQPSSSLRQFLLEKQEEIVYVNVDTPSILMDLDTPQDYLTHRPEDKSD